MLSHSDAYITGYIIGYRYRVLVCLGGVRPAIGQVRPTQNRNDQSLAQINRSSLSINMYLLLSIPAALLSICLPGLRGFSLYVYSPLREFRQLQTVHHICQVRVFRLSLRNSHLCAFLRGSFLANRAFGIKCLHHGSIRHLPTVSGSMFIIILTTELVLKRKKNVCATGLANIKKT